MSDNSYEKRWEILEKIGEGGQGTVHRVLDTEKIASSEELVDNTRNSMRELALGDAHRERAFSDFRECIRDIMRTDDPANHGALKILHAQENARDPDRAVERITNEIQAMSDASHPNLLKIIDCDLAESQLWYVSEFHGGGVLSDNPSCFAGDIAASLRAIRPLVAGVAELHAAGIVHRDIKPQNVFIASDMRLVLGDFGLVFFDETKTRISETLGNVGSRDWMPGWAMGMRIENVCPNFDVFSLGKLLWAMVSGKSLLQLWYYDRPQFNVEALFPDASNMVHANSLFAQCIVENTDACLPDAGALLDVIDRALKKIDVGGDLVGRKIVRSCKVCGIGAYKLAAERGSMTIRNLGFQPAGENTLIACACDHCGHLQLFLASLDSDPPGWLN